MRIKLIYPNVSLTHNNPKPSRGFYRAPPLNLLILAGLTPPNIDVEIIDERYQRIDFDEPVDLVGITALTSLAPRAYQIADEYRKRKVKVVIGGVHPSFLPDEAILHADSVVIGEAELIWPQLLKDFSSGSLKKFYHLPPPPLDTVPFPRWELLPNRKRYINVVQCMRGCPNNCAFCSVPKFSGRKIRTRPIKNVIEEIKRLPRGFISFIDDNLFSKPSYVRELFQALIPLKIRWGGEASLNIIKTFPDLLKLAAKAGCRVFLIGMESISQKALDAINKSFNRVKEFGKIVKMFHSLDISVVPSFIFGFDEDDPGVFERTLKFLNEIEVDAATFSILTPLPGTELFERLKSEGRIFERDWSKFDGVHVTFMPKKMTPSELAKGVDWIYDKFYSVSNTFRRILRSWRRNPFIIPINIAYFISQKRGLIID